MFTTARRILSTVAAVAILALSTAGPAAAELEPGSGPLSPTREGYVSDKDSALLGTGMGALLGTAVVGAAFVVIRRRTLLAPDPAPRESRRRGGVPDQVGDLKSTSGPRLA
ncbi:MAG: hypothetical protein ACXWDL_06430 [Nocardioides sp.]